MSWWRPDRRLTPAEQQMSGTFAAVRDRVAREKQREASRSRRQRRYEVRYSEDQPREENGRFGSGGGEAETALKSMEAGHNINIPASEVSAVLAAETKAGANVDLEHLGVAGTYIFKGDSGIPREGMPQIPNDQRMAFVEGLKAQGWDIHSETVPVDSLHPTQNDINGAKVTGIAGAIDSGKFDPLAHPLFSTSDGHILDGHHRWAAQEARQFETGKTQYVKTDVINANIGDVMKFANQFDTAHGVEHIGFATGPSDATKAV